MCVYKNQGFLYTPKENNTKHLLVYTQIMSIKPQPFTYTRKGQNTKHNTIGVYAKTSVKQGPCTYTPENQQTTIYTRNPTIIHIHQRFQKKNRGGSEFCTRNPLTLLS